MLVSHIVPQIMEWQSRSFNDFDYLKDEVSSYLKDSAQHGRIILVAPDVQHDLSGNIYHLIKEETSDLVLSKAASVANPVLTIVGDSRESWGQYKNSPYLNIAIDLDCFENSPRGGTLLEQKMRARFSFISSIKREIRESGKHIWLIGLAKPEEIKKYGREIFACLEDTIATSVTDFVPLSVYKSINEFRNWI